MNNGQPGVGGEGGAVVEVFLQLRKYYWRYRYLGLASLVFVVLTSALGLVSPQLLRMLVDRVMISGHYDELPYLALGVVGVAIVQGACRYGRRYLGHVFGANSVFDLRNALYLKLQSLSFAYYDTARTGDLMARLVGDVAVFRQFVSFGFANLLSSLLMIIFGFSMMSSINWRLSLLALATTPFLAVAAFRFRSVVHPAFSRLREAIADMSTAAQENITGVRTVKSFAREPHQIEIFSKRVDNVVDRHMQTVAIWKKFFPTMDLIGNMSMLLLLYVGGREVILERMSMGDLVASFSLIWYIVSPVQQLGYQINSFTQAVAAGERLVEILGAPETVRNSPDARPLDRIAGHVQFDNVTFSYDGLHPAVQDINLTVEAGAVVGIIGPTGSGKSTLVSLIPRFYDPDEGRVLIDGQDVRDVIVEDLRRQIGIVFQETFLFSTSIRENIAFGNRDVPMSKIEEAARMADAHDFIMELPQGYDTLVGERGIGLSGGQRQRIAIARALLTDPRILILDDATASVDMETEFEIQKALRNLLEGQKRTTFVIAHRISSVKDADLIIVLENGRIVERGTHDELYELGGVYRRICDVQLGDRIDLAG
ncbi:MAG: ABC transporter ATP-binding protein [Firmicutes bacterium]|jgi:ATP-binding cassette subfamily B protein|nr:ABC transporter ATP-binding protein [Bacillota bacterium]